MRWWEYGVVVGVVLLVIGKENSKVTAKGPGEGQSDLGIEERKDRLFMKLRMLYDDKPQTTGAVCLDGSSPGFYYGGATEAKAAQSWIIFLEGGGWCYSEQECRDRSGTIIGGSKNWHPQKNMGGPMWRDKRINPTFHNFNQVYIPYCDGGSFSGNRSEPLLVTSKEGGQQKLYLRGHRILYRVIEVLISDYGLNDATEVLLSGCSAGGLSVFIHCNEIGDLLHSINPNIKYRCMPGTGFFLDSPSAAGENVFPDKIKNAFSLHEALGGTSEECRLRYPNALWKCFLAEHTYLSAKYPMFILNSAYDNWQIRCILGATRERCAGLGSFKGCIEDMNLCPLEESKAIVGYGELFIKRVDAALESHPVGHGAFVHSCQIHCALTMSKFWETVHSGGKTMRDAVDEWWQSSSAPTAEHVTLPECHRRIPPVDCNNQCQKATKLINSAPAGIRAAMTGTQGERPLLRSAQSEEGYGTPRYVHDKFQREVAMGGTRAEPQEAAEAAYGRNGQRRAREMGTVDGMVMNQNRKRPTLHPTSTGRLFGTPKRAIRPVGAKD